MDRINAVLEEMDLKASNSSNAYELIMNLMKETPSKLQATRGNDGKPEDRG
jgi:hypothetical protein